MLPEYSAKANIGILVGMALGLGVALIQTSAGGALPPLPLLGLIPAIPFYWGCANAAIGKGQSPNWILLMLVPVGLRMLGLIDPLTCGILWFPGLVFLAVLPDHHPADGGRPRRGCLYVALAGFIGFVALVVVCFLNPRLNPELRASAAAKPAPASEAPRVLASPSPAPASSPVPSLVPSTSASGTAIDAAEAQRRALAMYPQLAVPNSALNREFVARYHHYQVTNKDYFKDPNWPLKLAVECQSAIKQPH